MEPRFTALLIYVFMALFVIPPAINKYELGKSIAFIAIYVFGIALLLGYHIIIPAIVRNWYWGSCRIHAGKYVICDKGHRLLVGTVFLKVIPDQPIAMMDKDRRLAVLQATQGLIAGVNFEPMITFLGVRDPYGENIKRRLEMKLRLRTLFTLKETTATREQLEALRRELNLLKQMPVILEGFFVAGVRDYDDDVDRLIAKLDSHVSALASRMAGLGLQVVPLKGEELRIILSFLLFGKLTKMTW